MRAKFIIPPHWKYYAGLNFKFSINKATDMKCSYIVLFLLSFLLIISCSGPNRGMFGSRSPHEKYKNKLSEAGLDQTVLGRSWLTMANKALTQPLAVNLPYRETGYFPSASPEAAGFRFTARRGDQLVITCAKKPADGFTLFMELWQPQQNEQPAMLQSADSAEAGLQYEIKKDGEYVLRLQPELLSSGEYTLTINTAPSLAFPVETKRDPRIGSFWGDARDAGARSHEGIDIFSPFRTPVIAAADGHVRTVGINNLGGKVIFLRPRGKDYTLYYAHLDSQMVEQGQDVRVGDTIGLVGNTGNARTTPPHLHFGIYTSGGAIDPLPFVKRDRPEAASISVPLERLNDTVRSEKNAEIYLSPDLKSSKTPLSETHTLLHVKAATDSWYKVQLPDGIEGFIPATLVNALEDPVRSLTLNVEKPLFDRPDSLLAARKMIVPEKDKVDVLAVYKNYYYVRNGKESGWLVR
jgi:peptidoglycan LD-endopeptidase LytH